MMGYYWQLQITFLELFFSYNYPIAVSQQGGLTDPWSRADFSSATWASAVALRQPEIIVCGWIFWPISCSASYHTHNTNVVVICQAFLKNKCHPRVITAVSRHIKTQKKPCDLELWPRDLKYERLLDVVKYMFMQKFHQAKCSGSQVTVHTNFFCPISQL